jgi:hypothetical protein
MANRDHVAKLQSGIDVDRVRRPPSCWRSFGTPDSELNEHQQRRLVVTCQYVDRLLTDLERLFIDAQSRIAVGRYPGDLVPAEQRLAAGRSRRTSRTSMSASSRTTCRAIGVRICARVCRASTRRPT